MRRLVISLLLLGVLAPGGTTISAAPTVHLGPISFADTRHGWVAGEMGRQTIVLGTADGGARWSRYVAPAKFTQIQFLDARHGWAIGLSPVRCGEDPASPPCRSIILSTSDGGRTWTKNAMGAQCVEYAHLQMIDGQHGWATQTLNFCASHRANSDVIATHDGGRSWHTVFRPPVQIESLHFGDRVHGWLVGSRPPRCESEVYHTRDGGFSWRRDFQLHGFCQASIDFVDASTGWLRATDIRACSMAGCRRSRLYHTVDGGVHWRLEQPARVAWFGIGGGPEGTPGELLFVNRASGWLSFSANAVAGGVAVTHDGGRHWLRRLPTYTVPDGNAAPITAAEGWITGCRANGNVCSVLLHTKDGGQNWQVVFPV